MQAVKSYLAAHGERQLRALVLRMEDHPEDLSSTELQVLSHIATLADKRHDQCRVREQIARLHGLDIAGLTPLQAACRILASVK